MKTWLKLKKNPQLWSKFFTRQKIIQSIREFFYQKNFQELTTPILVPAVIPESYLDFFTTYLYNRKGKKTKMYLITSPEASIKKLLVAGAGNCFEITKSFRNKETGSRFHNPEFTILEWYRLNANYKDIMLDCENLITFLCQEFNNQTLKINYQGKIIDLTPPWERITVDQALLKYAKVKYEEIDNLRKIKQVALRKGYSVKHNDNWETLFHQIYLNEVEPFLGQNRPTIIYDYPKQLAALAKIKTEDPRFAERFEFYIGGLELGDCYTELTDPHEQKIRFRNELKKIKVKADKDFLTALSYGLPNCAGIAVGIDRLVMLLTNAKTIQETLLFPLEEYLSEKV